jgi:hypothetical protein
MRVKGIECATFNAYPIERSDVSEKETEGEKVRKTI